MRKLFLFQTSSHALSEHTTSSRSGGERVVSERYRFKAGLPDRLAGKLQLPVTGHQAGASTRAAQVQKRAPPRGRAALAAQQNRRNRHRTRGGTVEATIREFRTTFGCTSRVPRGKALRAVPRRRCFPPPDARDGGRADVGAPPKAHGAPLPVGFLGVEEEALIEHPDLADRRPAKQQDCANDERAAAGEYRPSPTASIQARHGDGKGQATRCGTPVGLD